MRSHPRAPAHYGEIVTCASSMRSLIETLRRLEGSSLSVFIEGESGTGKELIARAIHTHSAVSQGPFITVNCGAVQRELVASELFGHKRGAFTGAIESRTGAFEAANGGTLFLDEVGELPLEVQPFLLRAIEQRTVTPVGDTRARALNVRLIAATNAATEELIRLRRFRLDLYHRLAAIRLDVPPLRQRPEDIALLAALFARRAGGLPPSARALQRLCGHLWPGNVRELRHVMESFVLLGRLPTFAAPAARRERLEDFVDLSRQYQELKSELVAAFSALYLSRLLSRTAGNVSAAARLSGIERSYLNKLTIRAGAAVIHRLGEEPASDESRLDGEPQERPARALVSAEGSTASMARSVLRQRS